MNDLKACDANTGYETSDCERRDRCQKQCERNFVPQLATHLSAFHKLPRCTLPPRKKSKRSDQAANDENRKRTEAKRLVDAKLRGLLNQRLKQAEHSDCTTCVENSEGLRRLSEQFSHMRFVGHRTIVRPLGAFVFWSVDHLLCRHISRGILV